MDNTKTHRLYGDGETPDDDQLRREVSALLAAKGGIDESQAKRLRKQWEARDSEPAADAGLAALFGKLRERVHRQVALREKQFSALDEQLAQLRVCLENGDVKQSQQLEQSMVAGLNRIAGLSSDRRQTIITGLEALRPKLRNLTSWRKWGTVQARDKMIAEINGIHDSGATLPQIARRIQQAREEWQRWDAAGEGGDKKRYVIFDRACTKAYQPCQKHFDKKKQQREKHSREREQICAAMEQEFEQEPWRDPPWKKLQQSVQAQIIQWRKSGQAEYKQRKSLQRRFDAVVAKFEERLDRERQRSLKTREKLIADVEQLAEQQDVRAALVELQKLKKQWVPTVTSSRGKEQALWKRYTHTLDQVYAKRDRERKDFTQALQQNLKAKQVLCAQIEDACRAGTHTERRVTIQASLGKWKEQWTQSGETPKAADKKINARYRDAIAQAQQALAKADADAEQRMQSLLRDKSLLCAALEALALGGTNDKRDEMFARWDAMKKLPDLLEHAIGERYQLACAAMAEEGALKQLAASLSANLATLHELLLQLEILTEQETPAEFSRQRMALQIQRLSAAMGKADASDTKSTEDLMRDILLVGAVDAAQHALAFERLVRCCNAIKASD